MPNRAADDFTTIRERLEQIRKEQEEASKAPEPKTEEQIHQEVYGDYCNGNSKEHTVVDDTMSTLSEDKWIVVIDPKTGEKKWEAAKGWNGYYYDSLMVDEEDNIIHYEGPYFDPPEHVSFIPNRVLP